MQSGVSLQSFNTQPPEGGWGSLVFHHSLDSVVSTHSRPKAAGSSNTPYYFNFHVSTHSRPKAAGWAIHTACVFMTAFQHTAARRRLDTSRQFFQIASVFQHTAARRRLEVNINVSKLVNWVSTHSRPKAAGSYFLLDS